MLGLQGAGISDVVGMTVDDIILYKMSSGTGTS